MLLRCKSPPPLMSLSVGSRASTPPYGSIFISSNPLSFKRLLTNQGSFVLEAGTLARLQGTFISTSIDAIQSSRAFINPHRDDSQGAVRTAAIGGRRAAEGARDVRLRPLRSPQCHPVQAIFSPQNPEGGRHSPLSPAGPLDLLPAQSIHASRLRRISSGIPLLQPSFTRPSLPPQPSKWGLLILKINFQCIEIH